MVEQVSPTDVVGRGRDSTASRPRIAFLIDEISGLDGGGTERQILQLIRLSKRLGYEPRLAVLRGAEWLSEGEIGCPIYSAGVGSLFRPSGWRACWSLIRWMRCERISLVQTFFVECNVIGPWMARLAGVPVVIGSRRNLDQWMSRALAPIQELANRSTDCLLANSQEVAETMIRDRGAPRSKIRVAYNGIDLQKFSGLDRERSAFRQSLGLAPDEILVGNISTMRRIKGVPDFVEAARLVHEKDPGIRFVLVGDGEDQQRVADLIRRYKLGSSVILAGAQRDVRPYLAAMDVGVLSSLAEGFSNSLLEYMAAGLAVVATEVGGNREGLEDTGILVPASDPQALADAILSLRSPALRKQFGQAARQRVSRFSLDQAERRMEEIYSEMLSLKSPRKHRN